MRARGLVAHATKNHSRRRPHRLPLLGAAAKKTKYFSEYAFFLALQL
jgi:hypothetical protein